MEKKNCRQIVCPTRVMCATMTTGDIRRFLTAAFEVRLGQVRKCVVGLSDWGWIGNDQIRKVYRKNQTHWMDNRMCIDAPMFCIHHSAETSRLDYGGSSNNLLFYISTIWFDWFFLFWSTYRATEASRIVSKAIRKRI